MNKYWLITLFVVVLEMQALADPFQNPLQDPDNEVTSWSATQDWAEFGCISPEKYHTGLDVDAADDSRVYSAHEGSIAYVMKAHNASDSSDGDGGLGNTVILFHKDHTIYSQYSHLSKFSPKIDSACEEAWKNNVCQPDESSEDSLVDAGQEIGTIGNTGDSDRPPPIHLHFETKTKFQISKKTSRDIGYTTLIEDLEIFKDPIRYLHSGSIRELSGASVFLAKPTDYGSGVSDGRPVSLRYGPSTDYNFEEIVDLVDGQTYEVHAEADATDDCMMGWWELSLPSDSQNLEGKPRFRKKNFCEFKKKDGTVVRNRSEFHRGWVCVGKKKDEINIKPVDPTDDDIEGLARASSALIIDKSGSMRAIATRADGTKATRLDLAKESLRAFLAAQSDDGYVSISSFANSASTELLMVDGSVPSANSALDSTLAKIVIAGGTNIGVGLDEGYRQLEAAKNGLKFALLLSDGEDMAGQIAPAVAKFVAQKWPVCTVAFGSDAGKQQLKQIAAETRCTYSFAGPENLVGTFQDMSSFAQNWSSMLKVSDLMAGDTRSNYNFSVSNTTESIRVQSSWPGSRVKIVLADPTGKKYSESSASRFKAGESFQLLEIDSPQSGIWDIEVSWSVAPTTPEQVNVTVLEKTDIFTRSYGLLPYYDIGQPVQINVDAMEVIDGQKQPLKNAKATLIVSKPEEHMVRMVQAKSSNWAMFKDVVGDVMKDVPLYDNGVQDDGKPKDGAFGGTFTETDKNGPYIYRVNISGQKRDGAIVERQITGSFQVGSILNNPVTASAVMGFQHRVVPKNISLEELLSNDVILDPLEQIEDLEGDAMDSLDELLK